MPDTTCAELAAQLGVTPTTVARHARALGLGRKSGSVRLLSPSDAAKIRKVCKPTRGNPDMAGNSKLAKKAVRKRWRAAKRK